MRLLAAALLALLPTLSTSAELDQRLTLRDLALMGRNSAVEVPVFDPATYSLKPKRLFSRDWDGAQQHSLRYDGALGGSEGLRLEWNLLATLGFSSGASPLPAPAQPDGRSAVLQRRLLDDPSQRFELEADQVALRWQGDWLSVAAGRQSVNLGESYYFSPLDFFLPFLAQQSYREFRPGVDAVRATFSPSRFSLVELIAVAGYAPLLQGDNSSDHPLRLDGLGGQAALLGRAQLGGERWSGTVLGGRLRQEEVLGAAAQIEAFDASLTLELLSGYSVDSAAGRLEATFGVTQQLNPATSARLEFNRGHFNRAGIESRQERGGLSLSVQASPLVTLTPAYFWYTTDGNADLSLAASVSVSDESVLELGFNAPILYPGYSNASPSPMELAPYTLSAELRTVL